MYIKKARTIDITDCKDLVMEFICKNKNFVDAEIDEQTGEATAVYKYNGSLYYVTSNHMEITKVIRKYTEIVWVED